MPDPQTKPEPDGLIERVRRGGEFDAALALEVAAALGFERDSYDRNLVVLAFGETVHALGAAVSLVERVRPGWRKGMREHDSIEGDGWTAWITSPDFHVDCYRAGDKEVSKITAGCRAAGDAPTLARALILALLKSLEAEGG